MAKERKERRSDRDILLSLCASLTLADHMGDVLEDVVEALKQAGIKLKLNDNDSGGTDIREALHELGAKTLYGTSVGRN